jgi:hypothetical protein
MDNSNSIKTLYQNGNKFCPGILRSIDIDTAGKVSFYRDELKSGEEGKRESRGIEFSERTAEEIRKLGALEKAEVDQFLELLITADNVVKLEKKFDYKDIEALTCPEKLQSLQEYFIQALTPTVASEAKEDAA